jgi:hypothetical protein
LPPSCRLKTLRLSLNLALFQPFLRQYTFSSFLYTHVVFMKHKSIVLAYLGGHKLWLRNARKNSCGCFEGSVCPSFHLDLQVESFDSFTRFILSSLTFFVTHHTSIVFYTVVTYNHSNHNGKASPRSSNVSKTTRSCHWTSLRKV